VVTDSVGAVTIVVGAPNHGGLPALMDASASRELRRHARSNIVIVNPNAPRIPDDGGAERVSSRAG
jgi:MFS transporter, ACDE family, multidrug resistance protein